MDGNSRIARLIAPPLEAMGFDLVRVRFGGGRRPVLQIMAERPDGTMTVEDCAEVSRAVSAVLDIEDPIPGEYLLEVSSPGIDRPLTRLADFERFKGFDAKVELSLPLNGRKRFRGRLDGLEGEDDVRLEDADAGAVLLPYHAIADAKLLLTDELIAASLKGQVPGGGPPPDDLADAEPEDAADAPAAGPARKTGKAPKGPKPPARAKKAPGGRATGNR